MKRRIALNLSSGTTTFLFKSINTLTKYYILRGYKVAVDKNRSYQLCFIIVGLFLIPLDIYLHLLAVEFIISSTVFIGGMVLLMSGIRYKERLK